MTILRTLFLLWTTASVCLGAVPTIGTNSIVTVPTRTLWDALGYINFRPGDGETNMLNPPIFSWAYNPQVLTFYTDHRLKKFTLQVATDSGFTSKIVDVQTESNLYNFLSPFPTNVPLYWRVGYTISTNATWLLSAPGWSLTPYAWSSTRSFTVATNAVVWDRSVFADPAYLASKGGHPHMGFNAANRAAVSNWLHTAGAMNSTPRNAWKDLTNAANVCVASAWWTNITNAVWWDSKTTPSDATIADSIDKTALAWQFTRLSTYTNVPLTEALSQMAQHFVRKKLDIVDWVTGSNAGILRSLAWSYDWLHEDMNENQRTNILYAIERHCHWILNCDLVRFPNAPPAGHYDYRSGDTNGIYPDGLLVERSQSGWRGGSHGYSDFAYAMPIALSAYQESSTNAGYAQAGSAKNLLDFGLNYMIGKPCFFGEDDGYNGRAYSEMFLSQSHSLHLAIWSSMVFPEASMTNNPYWNTNGIADWWDRMAPVGMVQAHEPYGDGTTWGKYTWWQQQNFGRNLAFFTQSGNALLHWQNEMAVNSYRPASDTCRDITIPYYFPNPNNSHQNTNLSRLCTNSGWAMSSALPVNTTAAFTNGVGFSMIVRPGGPEPGHSHVQDGAFQIWAYGSMITDSGAGMTSYSKIPMSHYCLMVNGFGPACDMYEPHKETLGRFIAWEDTPDYTYVAADLTQSYPREPISPGGWLTPQVWATLNSTNPLPTLSKVQRHLLFMRQKYFVLCDLMESTNAATLTMLYHVLETNLTLNAGTASLDYVSNVKKFLSVNTNAPDVNVAVRWINAPATLGITNLTGLDICKNPFTGEDYYTASDPAIYHRAAALWVSSKNPSTNFHILTVIYPYRAADPAPTITRLDDYTVEVDDGVDDDVVSFDPATAFPATLIVDLPALGSAIITNVIPPVVPSPAAAFSGTPLSGNVPLLVTFTDESTGTPTSWAWDLDGDGSTDSTAQNPTFNYTIAGNYSVTLTAINDGGSSTITKTEYIIANVPPRANFEASVISGVVPLTVNFTNRSISSTSWAWDFENNASVDSTEENPTHVYPTIGVYSVKLTINAGADSLVKTNYIMVSPPSLSSVGAVRTRRQGGLSGIGNW